MKELDWEHFEDRYKPIPNTIADANGHSYMFETYGEDYDRVISADPNKVWTLVDGDDNLVVIKGWHLVNRIGYFICEVPFDDDGNETYIY